LRGEPTRMNVLSLSVAVAVALSVGVVGGGR
jgi:hypothetical protein